MEEKENLLEGEYQYSFTSSTGSELNPEREFSEEFALFRFTGEISDLPKHFKRNVNVRKAERFEEGDVLVLKDGHVSTLNHDLDEFHVVAGDNRQKYEVDLDEVGEEALFCPFCGEQMWQNGQKQRFISCHECGVYFDIYAQGEQMVFEAGP